jgi:hypothetical protein
MLTRRLQVLIDEKRFMVLEAEAARRNVPVAVIVREAIDRAFPSTSDARQVAAAAILDATAMPVPDPESLRDELEELRGRRA